VLTVGNVSGLGALATMNNITSSLVTDLGTLATLNNIGLTNLNSTVIDAKGHLVTSLVVANEVLTNALASGTIVAGNATITNLKATNVNITGVFTPSLYYTPFKTINANNYTIAPSTDGNCIYVVPTSLSTQVVITFPSATTWDGLHIFIRIYGQATISGSATSFTTNLQSSGFSFKSGGTPIGSYSDTSTSLTFNTGTSGIYEFVANTNSWNAINYPTANTYDVGLLTLTSSPSYNISDETTVVFKNNTASQCYLPANPFVGQSVIVYRRGTDLTVNATNSKVIFQGGKTSASLFLAIGDSAKFIYDGEMWCCMYITQPAS
jgi:hypothetical protein